MKQRILTLLRLKLILFSCNTPIQTVEDCVPPPCAAADINYASVLNVTFCTSETDENCYDKTDLSTVTLRVRNYGELIIDTTFNDFAANDFSIKLGGGSDFLFAVTSTPAQHVSYDYEIIVDATSEVFHLTEFKFQPHDICECPNYQFEKVKVNGLDETVIESQLILEKP
jgi:hypothetical protein